MGGGANRTNVTLRLVPRGTNGRAPARLIARDLNRQLAGVLPGVIITTRASGGNSQMNRIMGGGDSRISLEIRGDDLKQADTLAQAAKAVMDKVPDVRNARVGRDARTP